MSEENKKCKCYGCGKEGRELTSEELEKVTGGVCQNGKYICDFASKQNVRCPHRAKIDGVDRVCTCVDRPTSKCHREHGDNCTCECWDKEYHYCKLVYNL